MARPTSHLLLALAFLIPACAGKSTPPPAEELPKACTKEAKVCPDGSVVGRTGPNCEFAPCPEPAGDAPAEPAEPEAAAPTP